MSQQARARGHRFDSIVVPNFYEIRNYPTCYDVLPHMPTSRSTPHHIKAKQEPAVSVCIPSICVGDSLQPKLGSVCWIINSGGSGRQNYGRGRVCGPYADTNDTSQGPSCSASALRSNMSLGWRSCRKWS